MSTQRISSVLLLPLLMTGAVALYAQAGRNQLKTDGKANQRPTVPQATPTPLPPAKETASVADDGEVIKISTQLVSIPVRVMDKKGRFIGGLGKESFKVFEDGVEQDISLFSNEHEPFTVALVLDMSYSTTFKIAEIQNAAIEFIDQLRPVDKVMVISFDEDVHMLCEATHDREQIYRAIKSTKIGTGTSLYEAVGSVMNERLRRIDGRKAIILLTDGVDTTSRRENDHSNLADAMELDALIYPIRYDTFEDVQSMKNRGTIIGKTPPITAPIPTSTSSTLPFPLPPTVGSPSVEGTTPEEYEKAKEYLAQLALRTGGRIYDASTLGNLTDAYSKIASELREFYSLGYYPKDDRLPGKTTSIKVKIDQPGLVVKTREGYIVPHKTKIKTN
jgi:Ca-activated chloride channel homolog